MENIKLVDGALLDKLKCDAAASPRKRANVNLHQHYDDLVQRLFIAMLPDSYVRPHRHIQGHKWEFFMVVEGSVDILFFDDSATVTRRVTLVAGSNCIGLEIPPNVWHATVCFEPVVFMEVKQGPYDVTGDKGFADWSPAEGEESVAHFLTLLKSAESGTQLPLNR